MIRYVIRGTHPRLQNVVFLHARSCQFMPKSKRYENCRQYIKSSSAEKWIEENSHIFLNLTVQAVRIKGVK